MCGNDNTFDSKVQYIMNEQYNACSFALWSTVKSELLKALLIIPPPLLCLEL